MNDESAKPRTITAPWEIDGDVRNELQALLAELEARLEAKEADWMRAGGTSAHAAGDGLANTRATR